MRELTLTNSSWTVDDDDNIVDANGRMTADQALEAAGISYGYARL
jgi:hypothetical protein